MSTESVQSWLESTLSASAKQWEYIHGQKLDDTFGWGAMFAQLSKKKSLVCAGGLLLTGPEGCGKHTAAAHMMQQLFSEGFDSICMDGFALEAWTFQQFQERFNALLDHFYDHGKGLCLCLSNMEAHPNRSGLLSFLGQTLNEYWLLRDELTPFFLILIDTREKDVPAIVRSRLQLCRMSLPDARRRKAFFERNAKSIKNYVSIDSFVKTTEGFSYAQLVDLVQNVEDLVDARDGMLPEEDFLQFVAEQSPEPVQEDVMKKLLQSAQQLMDKLPQMVSDAVVAARSSVPVATVTAQPAPVAQTPPAQVNQADFIRQKQDEVEKMRVQELALDLFGKEGVSALIQSN